MKVGEKHITSSPGFTTVIIAEKTASIAPDVTYISFFQSTSTLNFYPTSFAINYLNSGSPGNYVYLPIFGLFLSIVANL